MSSHPITIIAFFVLLFVLIWGYERLAQWFFQKRFGVTVYTRQRGGDHSTWHIVGAKSTGQHLLIHVLHIIGGIIALGMAFALTFGVDKLIVPLLGS